MLLIQDKLRYDVRLVRLNLQVAQDFDGRVVIRQLVQPSDFEDGSRRNFHASVPISVAPQPFGRDARFR